MKETKRLPWSRHGITLCTLHTTSVCGISVSWFCDHGLCLEEQQSALTLDAPDATGRKNGFM